MDPITLGMGAFNIGSSLFSAFGGSKTKVDPQMQQMEMLLAGKQNALRQQQMNLDAQRRKRDIIRAAQVATANSEAAAAGSGALNSSGIEGARGTISGQAGTNILGVSQNLEIGNQMFALDNQKALLGYQKSQQEGASSKTGLADYASAAGGLFKNNKDDIHSIFTYLKSI
jgi:hypothetical protein